MMIASAVLGWSESQFWASSPAWFRSALNGLAKYKNGNSQDYPTAKEYEEAKRLVAEQSE